MNKRKTPMILWLFLLLAVWIAACSTPPDQTAATEITPGATSTSASIDTPRLIAYYYGLDRDNHISDIPSGKLTDLIYAFINVSDSGECVSMDPVRDATNFPALNQLKQQQPGLHILVSVGGYNHSSGFTQAAVNDVKRRVFARSCVQFMVKNGFDGIDIDWETPANTGLTGNNRPGEERQNYTALMAELRNQLEVQGKKVGKSYLLTAALPAGPAGISHFELNKLSAYVNWMTVMAYAFYTGASPITNFNAPLYPTSTDPATNETKRLSYNGNAAVKAYLDAGVPANKISLGVPFYGRAWEGVSPENHGLYQGNAGPFVDNSVPKGTWSRDGVITYKALKQYYLGTWQRFWQEQADEPWLYNTALHVMVTYDDAQSLGDKADYVKTRQLGGISIWQISGDDDQHTLVDTLCAHLRP